MVFLMGLFGMRSHPFLAQQAESMRRSDERQRVHSSMSQEHYALMLMKPLKFLSDLAITILTYTSHLVSIVRAITVCPFHPVSMQPNHSLIP